MRRAVFFDRDGVLNKSLVVDGKPKAPTTKSQFKIFEHARNVLSETRRRGFLNLVVTNQPDIENGLQSQHFLDWCHKEIYKFLPIDDIVYCPHSQTTDCDCRKPRIGMIKWLETKWNVNLAKSVIVGDRYTDIICGQNAGMKSCFYIDCGYSEPEPSGKFIVIKNIEELLHYEDIK